MNHKDVVMNDIKVMLNRVEPPVTGECCIYRVPFCIRKLNEDAYTPKLVSVGPFHHHGHSKLQNMESFKLIHFKKFLERANETLESLIIYVEEAEPSVRRCYADTLDLSKKEFMKMILVDSGFIIELFWRCYNGELSEVDDFKPWLENFIRSDLLLLENQLPFFVLDTLFKRAFRSSNGNIIPSFLELALSYFHSYNKLNKDNLAAIDDVTIRHFTDLVRTFHLQQPSETPPREGVPEIDLHLPSATELLEAGVRFKVNTEAKCSLDLRFSGGVLEIPHIDVDDFTEILFRNLVALELCHYPYKSYITDYVILLDFLIDTNRDVDVLVQNGILSNLLGDSNSVANLYNRLGNNITFSNFSSHYAGLCQELKVFCRNPFHKLWATLRRDYGNTPWQAAASIAGIVLLFLSLVQSICSVIQVVQQHKTS